MYVCNLVQETSCMGHKGWTSFRKFTSLFFITYTYLVLCGKFDFIKLRFSSSFRFFLCFPFAFLTNEINQNIMSKLIFLIRHWCVMLIDKCSFVFFLPWFVDPQLLKTIPMRFKVVAASNRSSPQHPGNLEYSFLVTISLGCETVLEDRILGGISNGSSDFVIPRQRSGHNFP